MAQFNAPAPNFPSPKKLRRGIIFDSYGPDEVHPSVVYNARLASTIVRPISTPISEFHATTNASTPLTASNLKMVSDYLASNPDTCNFSTPTIATTTPDEAEGSISSISSTQSAPDRVEVQAFSTSATNQLSQIDAETKDLTAALTEAQNKVVCPMTESAFRSILKYAQNYYGPESRVVVGNLPSDLPNNELSKVVWEAFSKYGPCCACVFRGKGKAGFRRPYAIVQYTEHQDAAAAYYCGQEKLVEGRAVRVEFSARA